MRLRWWRAIKTNSAHPQLQKYPEKPKRRASAGRHRSTNPQQLEDFPSHLGTSAYIKPEPYLCPIRELLFEPEQSNISEFLSKYLSRECIGRRRYTAPGQVCRLLERERERHNSVMHIFIYLPLLLLFLSLHFFQSSEFTICFKD